MKNVTLGVVVHPDPMMNDNMPRYHITDLGKAYDIKDVNGTGIKGHIVSDPKKNGLILSGRKAAHDCAVKKKIVQSVEDMEEVLGISGTLSVGYGLIEGSGRGLFEKEASRTKKTLTVVQVGYKVTECLEIDTAKLSNPDAYNSGSFLHPQLQHLETIDEYLGKQGWHYVTKVYTGCKAVRIIEISLDSARERKKIEAEVSGKLKIGLFSLEFKGSFNLSDSSTKQAMGAEVSVRTLGGDESKLNVALNLEDVMDITKNKIDQGWDDYMKSSDHEGHRAVIRVEAEGITSAVVKALGLTEAERRRLADRVRQARERKEELVRQRLQLDARKRLMKDLILSANVQAGACKKLMTPYETVVSSFVEKHMRPLEETLDCYLVQPTLNILGGAPPPLGGNEAGKHAVNLEVSDWLEKPGCLNKSQMDEFHGLLIDGSREPVDFGCKALWDGPWVFGKPVGVPNEVVIFHKDVDLTGMSELERNRNWKFKVAGEDWDLTRSEPVADEDTYFQANDQSEPDELVIDMKKLPAFVHDVKYVGKKTYSSGHRYVGDWQGGWPHGPGRLDFPPHHEIKNLIAEWSYGEPQGCCRLRFSQLRGDARSEYEGAVLFERDTQSVSIQGEGILKFCDGTEKSWRWRNGRAIVTDREALADLLKQKWLAQDPDERLDFDAVGRLLKETERLLGCEEPGKKATLRSKVESLIAEVKDLTAGLDLPSVATAVTNGKDALSHRTDDEMLEDLEAKWAAERKRDAYVAMQLQGAMAKKA